jgi:hypothetical protein
LRLVALLGGVLLFAIGVRFMLVPRDAARTFGLARQIEGFELHYVIGLRDLWLGVLAMAFAALREWRALALWFGFGALVCFADAGIAWTSGGRIAPVVFHVVCGAACIALTVIAARVAAAQPVPDRP